jgi:NADH-quinone oxidoreductase subunit G
MPTIEIDGQTCEFEGRKTILQVALESGIEIPHYCYHPGLSIVASCRICLAEVAAPNPRNENKVELIPKLVPTCQQGAADGMQVHTQSPKAIANQKAVMEYLLINHPLDCPVCDQAGECHLQDYSYQYGRAESRFLEDKIKQPTKDIGPHVKLYSDRCIMCSRCVRFSQEVTGTSELGVFGRGNTEQIDIFPGRPLDNDLSGNVVDICPVGALLDKDFLFAQRVWFLRETPSIDGITSSGDNIWIHHNEGRIHRVKPRTNEQVNRWWISDEIRYGWRFVHHDDRLTSPRRMQYGEQIDVNWDKALQFAAEKLREVVEQNGPGGLALSVSPMLACEEAYALGRLITGLDPQATLAVGDIPVQSEDKTFPGGYTIRAEKCPNSRGVRRALELLVDEPQHVLSHGALTEKLKDKKSGVGALLATGNYDHEHVDKDLASALGKKLLVLIDTLGGALAAKAEVLLPGATWAEKAGAFENADGCLQGFHQAIAPLEGARADGQIALDLAAACGLDEPALYDPKRLRVQMGDVFASEVREPQPADAGRPEMEYVEL